MSEVLKTLRRAGAIAREVRELGAKLIIPGATLRSVCETVEAEIEKRGGKPAFPTQTSINAVAAHDCPTPDDERTYQAGDLAKLDIGVHIDGWVVDTATTVNVGGAGNGRMVEAARQALAAAIQACKPGIAVRDVSTAIERAITSAGFTPLESLCGHGVGQWIVHAPPAITNTIRAAEGRLPMRGVIAIEPFATDGHGRSGPRGVSEVFRLLPEARNRLGEFGIGDGFAQSLLSWRGLPIARRYFRAFGNEVVAEAFRRLEQAKLLHSYPPLVALSGRPVAQAEHSVYLGPEGVIQLT
ncbi:MAG: M24 family metallopeptidase [Vicinamibacteria bacterium]|nr:M24 family metallopeptidase [Vicinamibacteria bacterium]